MGWWRLLTRLVVHLQVSVRSNFLNNSSPVDRLAVGARAVAGEGISSWGVPGHLRLELPLSLRCQGFRRSVHYGTVDWLLLGRR